MSNISIDGLSESLRTDKDRLDALNTLASFGQLEPGVAQKLIGDLVYALESESNEYTLLQLLKELNNLADQHPKIASEAIPVVARVVNDTLEDHKGDDPSENLKVNLGSEVLEAIFDATDPIEASVEINYRDIRAFAQQGDGRRRAIGYRLLGRAATGEAVRILLQDFGHEIRDVKDSRELALAEARELVTLSLQGGGSLDSLETLDSFTEFYKHDELTPEQKQLNDVYQIIFDLVGNVEGQCHDQLLSAIKRLAQRDEDSAESITSKAFKVLSTDAERRADMWELLRACAKGSPTVLSNHSDTLSSQLDSDAYNDTRKGLEVVKVMAEKLSSAPASLADSVTGQLESDDNETVKQAIRTISVMGFYPAPQPLEALINQGGSDVAKKAKDAKKEILANEPSYHFFQELKTDSSVLSLFEGDPGDVHLKRKTDTGRWIDVRVGSLRKGIVETVVERSERGENVPVSYPYYEPKDVILLTLGLVLNGVSKDIRVGLHSPGSQTQWGTKGEIRDELRRYGLSDISGEVIYAKPVPELVPDAYVSDGQVKKNSDGEGPGQIILSKKISDLEAVSDLDVTVLNWTSRSRLESQEEVRALEEAHPGIDLVSAYSCYTRNEAESRPRYGPPSGIKSAESVPGVDLLDPIVTEEVEGRGEVADKRVQNASESATDGLSVDDWILGDDEVRAFSRTKEIRIEHVEADSLTPLFDQLFEESAKLRNSEDKGASGLIFSRQMFFERLPVPTEDYDEWVRERLYDGDRFVPPLVHKRIEDVERKASSVENLEAVQPLNNSKNILERIHDNLRQSNPLFEVIQDEITEAKQEDLRLAIFSESPKNALLLRDVLLEHGILSSEDVEENRINVVSPNDTRSIGPHDRLLVLGALHPENAGFYVHPRVSETVVATYDRSWATMIERHASEFVDLLNEAIGGSDYTPFALPKLVGDIETEESDIGAETATAKGGDEKTSKAHILEEALRSVSSLEASEDASRYERERRHFGLELDDEERIDITNHDKILRRGATAGGYELHWINPDNLSVGDTVVIIPKKVKNELWRERLTELYEEEVDTYSATEGVEKWHNAIEEIWASAKGELSDDDGISDLELHRTLFDWITKGVEEFDRNPQTVRLWFDSVLEAEGPMELAEDPSLVIGPQSHRDIEAIGRALGHNVLESQAVEIEKSMKAIRNINRSEGHDFREYLQDQMNADEDSRVSKAATSHKVTDIKEGGFDTKSSASGEEDVSDGELHQRIINLVELAPTKNSELADEWGFDSGSDLYQFLSSEMAEYYERDQQKLIIPTEKAREIAENSSKTE